MFSHVHYFLLLLNIGSKHSSYFFPFLMSVPSLPLFPCIITQTSFVLCSCKPLSDRSIPSISRCHPLQRRSFAIPRTPDLRLDQKLVGPVSACFPRHDAPVKESILPPAWCPFHLETLSPPTCSILSVSSHELSVAHRKAGRTLIWHYTPGSCIGLRSLMSPGRKQRPSPQRGVGLRLRRMLPALPAEPVRRISL